MVWRLRSFFPPFVFAQQDFAVGAIVLRDVQLAHTEWNQAARPTPERKQVLMMNLTGTESKYAMPQQ